MTEKKRKVRNKQHFLSLRYLLVCICCFFVLLFFLSSDRISTLSVRSESLKPVLRRVPSLSVLSSIDLNHRRFPALVVQDRVQFPDHLLLILSNGIVNSDKTLVCVYYGVKDEESLVLPSVSNDEYVVRCPNAPLNYSSYVELQFHGDLVKKKEERERKKRRVYDWEKVVYEAVIDGDTVVVFVKGLTRRPHKESDPLFYKCQFEIGDSEVVVSQAVAASQEVVRCVLPERLKVEREMFRVSVVAVDPRGRSTPALPSVARVNGSELVEKKGVKVKHELCVCTMLWNQAPFLREWITYHAWLGVERWFIYDNNSDDDLEEEIELLNSENYNVSRHVWPWIKTQEAGFSHCAVRAKDECNWVGFFDVDEFYYFPTHRSHGLPSKNALRSLVSNYTSWDMVGEIRTECHSYGPSGLTTVPAQGVTVGYTCRQANPERHKSIVRPEMLTSSLLNEVHHFQLKEGIGHMSLLENVAVVNHYKYQVWNTFKAKFYRRVATYVVDWQENQNQGSKDRAPGLGTEAIEPADWKRRFCEVWDTGLRDLVLSTFADQVTGFLPWQRQQQEE